MKKFVFLTLATLLGTTQAFAYVHPEYRDLKLATQQMIEKQLILAPVAASTTRLLSANAGSTAGAPAEVTSFLAQPDVARNLTVTTGGTTADVKASSVIVYGTDFFGASIMEVIAISDNLNGTATGTLAFQTVSKVILPAEEGAFAASWSVGVGEKLGMKRCMDHIGNLVFATVGGTYEATRPTVVVGASVASNTADVNGTMNSSNDVELFFIQNFVCQP